ncbi:MAG: divalent-cation tolerance protein CutA [Actinobacteria bacterium]|nr:divalent-cation tolerance protein CutA [Actinomycetota bacterium]MBO0817561.1 divalent-cation tolerance protein CutA [Actinomycetota bacterium]
MAGQGSTAGPGTDWDGTPAGPGAPRFLQVQTTTDSRAEAVALSRAAVEARLAACAQVAGPVASVYWWEDAVERAEEWLVLLKLPASRYPELAEFLLERHSYDEPEIVATPLVAGSVSYLSWIETETRPAEPGPAETRPAETRPEASQP